VSTLNQYSARSNESITIVRVIWNNRIRWPVFVCSVCVTALLYLY